MRKPSEFIYYFAGTLCLVVSVFLILQSDFSPASLSNRIFYERADRGYRDFYESSLPLHRNDLRQAAVFLPVYSVTCDSDVERFAALFDMLGAQRFYADEYVRIYDDSRVLTVYNFLDMIEFEQTFASVDEGYISDEKAKEIARNFAKNHLHLNMPYDVEITRAGQEIEVALTEKLGKIPNHAFPTTITLDQNGNVTRLTHFYFEYEELARGDLLTPHAALSALPRLHEGIARSNSYKLVYIFEQSILQPAYIFNGSFPCGTPFSQHVPAIKFYH